MPAAGTQPRRRIGPPRPQGNRPAGGLTNPREPLLFSGMQIEGPEKTGVLACELEKCDGGTMRRRHPTRKCRAPLALDSPVEAIRVDKQECSSAEHRPIICKPKQKP